MYLARRKRCFDTGNFDINFHSVALSLSISRHSFGNIVKVSNGFNSANVETVMVDKYLLVVWQESVHDAEEILLKKSTDRGITFSQTVDLSNNGGISECPSFVTTEGNLHIVWQDNTTGNNEVFYKQIQAET